MRLKFLPTKYHAIDDYLTVAIVPFLPRLFGWSKKTRWLMDGVAAITAAQSLMTDYEGGVARVEPMQCHLTADKIMGAGLITTACLMTSESPLARLCVAGLGACSLATALTTKRIPTDEKFMGPSDRYEQTMDHVREKVKDVLQPA
jgi:hypothetical protein